MRKWKLERDWALLTAHSWQVTEPDSSLSLLLLRLRFFHCSTGQLFFFLKLHLILPQKLPVLIVLDTEEPFTGQCSAAIARIVSFSQTAWNMLLMKGAKSFIQLVFIECFLCTTHTLFLKLEIQQWIQIKHIFYCFQGALGQRVSQIIN